MQQSRRAYLRGAGGIALGVGLAGCSSGDDGSGDGGSTGTPGGDGSDAGTESDSGSDATASSSSGDAASNGGDGSSATPGKDASATELSGTVADKSAEGLSFVEHSHYSINGVEGVTGRLENTSDAPFREVTIHVTVQPGGAGPYTETMSADELAPGDTWRFKFRFGDDAPDEVAGYTVWATGQKA